MAPPLPRLYSDAVFLEHRTGDHPESPRRLESIWACLGNHAVSQAFEAAEFRPATREEVGRVHDPAYVGWLQEVAERGGARIESDTVMSGRSFDVACWGAGAAVAAVDAVLTGAAPRACCLVRPPGHHALYDAPMGFCLLNNIAVAAAHARQQHRVERVLIVDWDVHHGNGTQDLFYESESVVFYSSHRYPFYPGTGSDTETGSGHGLGSTFNLPLAFGTPRNEILGQFERLLHDAARRAQPELVLISAGFDAHRLDPIGSLGLETEDFAELTRLVIEVAEGYCGGKVVSVLEGGYNVQALAESVAVHLESLAGGRRGIE